MTLNGWLQIALFFGLVVAVTVPLGRFMTRVFARERTWLDPVLRPIERGIYALTGVDEKHEMRWTEYAAAMLLFSVVSMVVLYAIERLQGLLPFNPQKLAGRAARARLQYRRVVHDEHELAGLQRRVHDELSHADGGPRVPQLHLGGRRHRARDRVHPRHRAAGRRTRSAISGWTLTRADALGAAAGLPRRRARARVAGRRAESAAV